MGRASSYLLLFVVLAGVLLGSLLPNNPLSDGGQVIDKFQHAGAYALLTVLALRISGGRGVLWIALVLFGLGAGIELAQQLMHYGREGSRADLLANGLGIILGILIFKYKKKNISRN